MTVSTFDTRKRYPGTGAQLIFAYTWKIYAGTDLNVWLTDLNGAHTQQILNTHYTVSGVGIITGGNVTFITAPLATSFVTIVCDLPLTQETDFVENDSFPAVSQENGLDRLVKIAQQFDSKFNRVPVLPEATSKTSVVLPENISGYAAYLRWNAAGTALELVVDLPVGGGDQTVGGNLVVGGTITAPLLTPAGFVKNSVTGLLSTAPIAAGDLPAAISTLKLGAGIVSDTELGYLDGAASNIQAQINALAARAATLPFAILQNRRTQNTGGGTATLGSWLIVPLNVEYEDANDIVDSTALPAFSLGAGTYKIEANCPFVAVETTQIRLYNVTDAGVQANVGALPILGTSAYSYLTHVIFAESCLIGTFTITGTKQFRIEYRVAATRATDGLGYPSNFGVEVYAQVKITKMV